MKRRLNLFKTIFWLALAFLVVPAIGHATTATVFVPGNAGPWMVAQNPTFDYGVHDNAVPTVISSANGFTFTPGSVITVSYVSGTASAGYGPNGDPSNITNTYDSSNGKCPGYFMDRNVPVYGGEFVGTFANNGVIVGQPFPIGGSPATLTIPSGANQLLLGINDNYFSDNTGGFTVSVSSGSTGPVTYNAVNDFSNHFNPSGAWSYGFQATLGGAFTAYSLEDSATISGIDAWQGPENCGVNQQFPLLSFNHTGSTLNYNGGVSQPPDVLQLHPSCTSKFSVLRWTAPTGGWFKIAGRFQGIDTRGTSTDVHVLLNSANRLLFGDINGFGSQYPFNFTRYFAAGQTVDFVVGVGSNGNFNADSTGVAVTISEAATQTFNIADGDVASLVAAIQNANTHCDGSITTIINLAPGGLYTLTGVAEYPREYNGPGASGLPVMRVSVTINGNGATIQRSSAAGTPDFVILAVSGRTEAGPPACDFNPLLTLNQTILTGGSIGGLHLNSATGLVQGSTVTNNAGNGINDICSTLNLLNSTVSYNTSNSAWGGGGVFLWGFSCAPDMPRANISFSTIFENANPGWGRGNGIAIAPNYSNPGSVVLKNSILASPSHPEATCNNGYLNNILLSQGHNILGDDPNVFGSMCASALTAPGDLISTNPQLGSLVNNGGLTPTDLPQPNSPAIDSVPLSDCSDVFGIVNTTDQRGVSRPIGTACDIGAVETPPDVTAPLIQANLSGVQGLNGWYRSNVGVSWSVSDLESGIVSSNGCDPTTLTSETAGTTLTCSATNGVNLTNSTSVTVIIDETLPIVSANRSPVANSFGWNNSSVTATFSGTDTLSGIGNCGTPLTLDSEAQNQSASGSCSDNAGNSASATVSGINIDKTPPTAYAAALPAPNAAGWNNSAVTVTFSGTDALSGIASCVAPVTLSSEGASQLASGTCMDRAGNISPSAQASINIDLTKPQIVSETISPDVVPLGLPFSVSAQASDNLSGILIAQYSTNGGGVYAAMTLSGGLWNASIGSLTVGVYNVCVRTTDKAGNTSDPVCQYLPVYDPSAGFVTGGGKIDSPYGGYEPNPSLTGKATFGFVSRYQNGATTPTGNTEFEFQTAGLNFHSTSYDWLVVAGAKAQFKGSGTINGSGDYEFRLTATDGDVNGGGGIDKFRIKIWNRSAGEAGGVVYDNMTGASDDTGNAAAIASGSIVIHK